MASLARRGLVVLGLAALLLGADLSPAQNTPLVQEAVLTDFSGFSDYHAHTVVNKKPPSYPCSGVNLNIGKMPVYM